MSKMRKEEKWICKCGLKHKITNKNVRENKYRSCPFCNMLPPKWKKDKARNSKMLRALE